MYPDSTKKEGSPKLRVREIVEKSKEEDRTIEVIIKVYIPRLEREQRSAEQTAIAF